MENIRISKCKCDAVFLPPVEACRTCGSETSTIAIEPIGIVLSFTRLHIAPAGFSAPLGIALVELSENVRIMCNTQDDKTYEIGDKVYISSVDEHFYIMDK